jgi:two-component sensor histidine kinase
MFKINQEKVEEMKKNAEKIIEENSHLICYGIGVGVGVLAGIAIIGPKAKSIGYSKGMAQALKDVCTSADGIVDLLVEPKVEHNRILLQLTKHSVAGNFDVSSALTSDTARSVAKALNEAADAVDESIKQMSVVNF